MSLYNMIHGFNPACFFFLPMLGKRPEEYPRFRDCFTRDDERPEFNEGHIIVYTRTGGGNRENYIKENQAIRDMPGFVTDYDDDFDCTFANWVFKVPDQWREDYEFILAGELKFLSQEYRDLLRKIYPKLTEIIENLPTP
jgi:hypothetical protein